MLSSALSRATKRLAPIYGCGKPWAMQGASLMSTPLTPYVRSAVLGEPTRAGMGIKQTNHPFSSVPEDRQGKPSSTGATKWGPPGAAVASFVTVKSSETIQVLVDENVLRNEFGHQMYDEDGQPMYDWDHIELLLDYDQELLEEVYEYAISALGSSP